MVHVVNGMTISLIYFDSLKLEEMASKQYGGTSYTSYCSRQIKETVEKTSGIKASQKAVSIRMQLAA
jgi:hypothetical protein